MKTVAACLFVLCALFLVSGSTVAQDSRYRIRVDVVDHATTAIAYPHRGGSTTIGFRGTSLQPRARGEAKVESKQGYTEIEVEFDDMAPATRYGREYLTYVMWSVTPQGRTSNLGEVILNGTKSKLDVTTELETFGLIVTAEPYFAVTQPTNMVVLENYARPDTRGNVQQVTTRYSLAAKSRFEVDKMPRDLKPSLIESTLPLDLQQARHATRIAEWTGGGRYAPDLMRKLQGMLTTAEELYVGKAKSKRVSLASREVVQTAEDVRLIAARASEVEELAKARRPAPITRRRVR